MSIKHGSLSSIGATALQLVAPFTDAVNIKGIYVVPSNSNTGIVFIGKSTVTAGGTPATNWIPLYPTSPWLFLQINDPTELYAIATTTGNEVFFLIQY